MVVLKKTPLNKVHHDLKSKLMDFAGWELPAWYISILEEHKATRSGAGIFDESDMGRVWITGKKAGAFLDRILTKPVRRLEVGSSQLSLLCLENGGIFDDYSCPNSTNASKILVAKMTSGYGEDRAVIETSTTP